MSLQELIKQMPPHYYVCQEMLWCGNIGVEINHYDNILSQPLDYESAFKKMLAKLEAQDNQTPADRRLIN